MFPKEICGPLYVSDETRRSQSTLERKIVGKLGRDIERGLLAWVASRARGKHGRRKKGPSTSERSNENGRPNVAGERGNKWT